MVTSVAHIPPETSLKELLKDLDLHGALLTADAMHTQKATAAQDEAFHLFPLRSNRTSS